LERLEKDGKASIMPKILMQCIFTAYRGQVASELRHVVRLFEATFYPPYFVKCG